MMTLENYPLLKKGTYLNTAYMGLMSVSLSIIEEIMKRDI